MRNVGGLRAVLWHWAGGLSTPGQSPAHGNAASNPLRAGGAPLPRLRFSCMGGRGWVADIGGCIAGSAHPTEKSAPGFVAETIQPAHVSLWLRPDTTSKDNQADEQHAYSPERSSLASIYPHNLTQPGSRRGA